jgi:CRISPR system Cascade subunit CasC
VEAAVQVSHAISTHKMEHEFDYFTAVDDLPGESFLTEDKGADMIGDVEFTSACYYKYFSIDFSALVDNLAGPRPNDKATAAEAAAYDHHLTASHRLARHTVMALLRAAVFTTPSGKQNTFAAHQLPDAILVEAREQHIPISYANAFVKAVQARESDNLIDLSIERLTEHVDTVTRKFSLKPTNRYWFTTRDAMTMGAAPCDTLDDLLGELDGLLEGQMTHG